MKQYIKKETRLADFDPCPRFIWNEGLSSLAISVYTPVSYTHLDVYKRQASNEEKEKHDEKKLCRTMGS